MVDFSHEASTRKGHIVAHEDDGATFAQPFVSQYVVAPASPGDDTNQALARSRSRYRRRENSNSNNNLRSTARTTDEHDQLPEEVEVQEEVDVVESSPMSPARLSNQSQIERRPSSARYRERDAVARRQSQRHSAGNQVKRAEPSPPGYRESLTPPMQAGTHHDRRVDSAEIEWSKEDSKQQQLGEQYSRRREPEARSPGVSSPLNKYLEPPPVEIRATKSMSSLRKHFGNDDDMEAGCFGLFKRKRGDATTQMEQREAARPSTGRTPPNGRSSSGGAGIDAPVSAVNAGDRHVLVECGKSKNIFPITPTTTSVDIIKSAAASMRERIDVRSAVLLESFGTVGVQRPLRRYEHIRDVMNSWDTDRQNSLLLIDPGTGHSEAELSVSGVPTSKPGDESWPLFYSQKPGKWDKRYITLHTSGQLTLQKDVDKAKDIVNIAHLSDFDIYTPTLEKIKKKIKPPKRICFAIKSQQKTAMFESTQDFVHFFCTSDRQTADAFYTAVQGWRSWYLVNVLGEGRKPKSADGEKVVGAHQRGMGSATYAITPPGVVKSANQFDTTVSPERRTSTARRKPHPPGAMSNRAQLAEDEPLVNLNAGRRGSMDKQRPSLDRVRGNSSEEFAAYGLLGRTYSQKQKDLVDRDVQRKQDHPDPFTKGPNLLNTAYGSDGREDIRAATDVGLQRSTSTRTSGNHHTKTGSSSNGVQRSNSRAKPKPLVDLTPQYREPPQHSRKGKGYVPEAVGAGGLIENATSPEDAIGAPTSTDWRAGRNVSSSHAKSAPDTLSRAATNPRSTRRPHTSRDETAATSVSPSASAFTGEGLLATTTMQQSWRGTGRGVMDGSRAKGPMLDLNEESTFANGSLLRKVELEKGPAAPVIDRSREG